LYRPQRAGRRVVQLGHRLHRCRVLRQRARSRSNARRGRAPLSQADQLTPTE
jgi:hypothetical protein